MNGTFLENPNLPKNDVSAVAAANCDKTLLKALSEKSIKVFPTDKNAALDSPVSLHADILVHHLGGKAFIIDKSQQTVIKCLEKYNCDIEIVNSICSPYPNDCLLNCADIGDYLVCNTAITHPSILSTRKTVINVKQGYSKCSVCIADKNTIITDDASVYNAVRPFDDIKCLLVEKGSVVIEKYDYGFIGGCSGLIGKKKLFFNGDLSTHKSYKEIYEFLGENNIACFDIKNKPLTDIGSILPIIERK